MGDHTLAQQRMKMAVAGDFPRQYTAGGRGDGACSLSLTKAAFESLKTNLRPDIELGLRNHPMHRDPTPQAR